jgi:TolB-like protein
MNKMIFLLTAIIFILIGLTSSCASFSSGFGVAMVENTSETGVIVQVTNTTRSDFNNDIFTVFIDDKKIGSLKYQDIKGYKLKNGIHTIYFVVEREAYPFKRDETFPRRFTVNNDRHYFDIGRTVKEGELTPLAITKMEILPVQPKKISARSRDSGIIDTAINNSFYAISESLPVNSKIALVNISSSDNDESIYILEELTVLFVNSRKFTIVDRHTLNTIRQERNFQLSGEVNDETIISIGNFTGADLVITGSVSGDGERRRLRMRVLDVKTAQVLAASSEKI